MQRDTLDLLSLVPPSPCGLDGDRHLCYTRSKRRNIFLLRLGRPIILKTENGDPASFFASRRRGREMCHKALSRKNGEGTIKTQWRVLSSLVGQIGLPAERDPLPLLLFRRRNHRHHHQHRRQKRRGERPQSPFVPSFPLLGGPRRAAGG